MSGKCCTTDEEKESYKHNDGFGHSHSHNHGNSSSFKTYIPAVISLILLISGMLLDHFNALWFNSYFRIGWYLAAFAPVSIPVFSKAFETIKKGEVFTEFTLMSIATLGAFALGQYAEGVAVMLFYTVGELFQHAAVSRATGNIRALLDLRPESATVFRNGQWICLHPEEVKIGEKIQIKVGEKVPLDAVMVSDVSSFNTAALTGESKPDTIQKGELLLAGMLNLEKVAEAEVTKKFDDSSLSKILKMVDEASRRKAKTELFIRKFAKIYTPIIFSLAVALMLLPYFFVNDYHFRDWFYRAMIFLVISCPCALVISIPLGYFGGIGAASRNGILFKGSNFLDLMAAVNTVVMDKTGTLTQAVFEVNQVNPEGIDTDEFLDLLSAVEKNSTHPVAKAITSYHPTELNATQIEEIPGHGLKAFVSGKAILAGNSKLMKKFGIEFNPEIEQIVESIVIVSIDSRYSGYVTISDKIKEDSKSAISQMKTIGIEKTVMLSGDKNSIVQKTAKELGISLAYGDLLPEEKVEKISELKKNQENTIAFVGDGINDAPVLAVSDVGIAMGGMGSDVAIETADVVIQTDQPSKIPVAIRIGKKTKQIVIQNIALAFGVKLLVMILGAGGLATLWEAVFADVGVAFLAILNAIRIQNMKF